MNNIFQFDSLSKFIIILISLISLIIIKFSYDYLNGSNQKSRFLREILFLATSLIITYTANNIIIFLVFWILSNLLLVKIIIYNKSWIQAYKSGILALKNFLIGFFCLFLAITILHYETGSYEITEIINNKNIDKINLAIICTLLILAAMCQSAIFPFHSWLISSLNSPAPASAIMHAGIVNGGGILIVKFSALFLRIPDILTIIFIIGSFSAIIGTLWKLIQGNVKSMLACSTISQMGFMIAQCGMGLFSVAISHLIWHGLFKSYLFLSSPSSWQEKRLDLGYPPPITSFILSLICGSCGAFVFSKIINIQYINYDTTLILTAICFIATSQVALSIIGNSLFKKFIPAFIFSLTSTIIYANSLLIVENNLPKNLFTPQPLNIYYIITTILFFVIWIGRIFWFNSYNKKSSIRLWLYVKILNSSQPKDYSITSNRNQYNFK